MCSTTFCLKAALCSFHVSVGEGQCSFFFSNVEKSCLLSPFSLKAPQRELQRDLHQDPSPLVKTPWAPNLGDWKPLACLYHFSRIVLFFLNMLHELELKAASSNYPSALAGTLYEHPVPIGLTFMLTNPFRLFLSVVCYRISGKSAVEDWAFGRCLRFAMVRMFESFQNSCWILTLDLLIRRVTDF